MKEKLNRENTYIVQLPLDPEGANDPALIEAFPEHARMIGYIVAEWSQVEYKTAALVAIALRVPFQVIADMVYALESGGARMDVMRGALSHLNEEPARSEVEALFTEADSLRHQRNKFAHGLYGHGPNRELVMHGVRKASLGEVPLHDLMHQYGRMKALSYRAGRLVSSLADMFQEQPQGPGASASLPSTALGSTGPQSPPSPPEPPPPSPND
jgi:hypothetical protein